MDNHIKNIKKNLWPVSDLNSPQIINQALNDFCLNYQKNSNVQEANVESFIKNQENTLKIILFFYAFLRRKKN
ncbi:hypothetical protein BpHYR1_010917 [Brachionus plicatilis]|uniref:Uncharacterized protein n=1 Tax=Brachionus plicatilis TaxID=10195 RepID=A0A3M7QFI6_BRAPC|nr:hypothetical protein BpHYR1_010917 [Brachionus plicatilis]